MEDLAASTHIHDALRQVRELKRRLIYADRFTGYSGRVRAVGGTFALLGAIVMSRPAYPATAEAHLAGWIVVLGLALVANYSALFHWFLFHPDAKRDIQRLVPTVDAIPPLIVAGILSGVLIARAHFELLPGTWMCLYGLANLSSRRVLPRAIWSVGIYYMVAGASALALPPSFVNPWPMGLVFFVGEWAGGLVFHYSRVPDAPMSSFFLTKSRGR